MAHVMKFTKASCGHMFAHFDRRAEHISNENLDRERTHLNYNLATHQTMDQGEFVRKRCAEVRCQNRKDVNVMATWVVTVPKDLPEQEHKAFFQASYDFLQQRYGRENVVSAYVHMDEITPHLHYAWVPIVEDKRRGGYKLSAKEAVNRRDLQAFHGDLERHLEAALGHRVAVLNEATKEGNRSIQELRRGTAREEVAQLRADKQRLQAEVEKYEGVRMQKAEIDAISPQYAKSFFGRKKELKGVTLEDIEQLKGQATAGLAAQTEVEDLKKMLINLRWKVHDKEEELECWRKRAIAQRDEIQRLQKVARAWKLVPIDVQEAVRQQLQQTQRRRWGQER